MCIMCYVSLYRDNKMSVISMNIILCYKYNIFVNVPQIFPVDPYWLDRLVLCTRLLVYCTLTFKH